MTSLARNTVKHLTQTHVIYFKLVEGDIGTPETFFVSITVVTLRTKWYEGFFALTISIEQTKNRKYLLKFEAKFKKRSNTESGA
jgi:hypothetical protein